MSTMKNGFSTLNRWLGKKNKDKSVSNNGKLSASKHNLSLSISTTNINEPSQLEYNRITPSPAATSNAPFEQTFRVTVLLPKDQLYVTRLGARVPLSKLLELVSENKLLNPEKYEFRNPVDASQVFGLNLSIGAVGLSEIRLCLKTEPYDNFNTDEVVKLRRTGNGNGTSTGIRDSCSSSEFSSRQSKITTAKTISPYSSSNSLNSLESSSVHYARVSQTPPTPNTPATPTKVTAPPRKKRAAPRPPSHVTIHEKEPLTNGHTDLQSPIIREEVSVLNKKNYYVSTPDLATSPSTAGVIFEKCNSSKNGTPTPTEIIDANELYARVEKKNVRNLAPYGGSVQNLSTTIQDGLPEPSPRKRIIPPKSKKAPAPPASNRSSACIADDESFVEPTSPTDKEVTPVAELPKPVPRSSTTLQGSPQLNVSKVLLNRTPTPEPRSLSSESTGTMACEDDDAASKQADSGIGEPVPSPLPESLKSEGSTHETKSTFESSSDDDEMIRVYNFKLGKTVTQPLVEHEMIQTAPTPPTTPETNTTTKLESEPTPCLSETTSWNFCIPISPPANFADDKASKQSLETEEVPDIPITPKIQERPVLNFAAMSEVEINNNNNNKTNNNTLDNVTTPLDEIVDELSAVIQDKGVNSLMRKVTASQEIESAKPNTLSNFSITSIEKTNGTTTPTMTPATPTTTPTATPTITPTTTPTTKTPLSKTNNFENSEVLSKRNSLTLKVNRADSFHTAMNNVEVAPLNGLNSRSSSLAALAKLDSPANNIVNHGKSSSSELSIKESPSLQSLEIIKTILNSRKNSLATNSGSEAEATEQTVVVEPKVESTKPLPKTYRYSGPPSINLGCWNERPKTAQVAIKNEGDYIFGGKSLQKTSASNRHSIDVLSSKEKSSSFKTVNETTIVTSPIKRMGIPEKDYRVPITVKPLKDFCVDSTPKLEQNVTTLPRNKFQQGAAVKRSVSITTSEAKEKGGSTEVPFGQNTLRKTGFKEKFLASQEETKPDNKTQIEQSEKTEKTNGNIFAVHLRKQPTKQVFHTKLNIPLQKSMSVQQEQLEVIRPSTPKSAPVAPPPPPLKPVKTPNNTPTTPISDPRDQLLDSIRNFKREKLKQSTFQK